MESFVPWTPEVASSVKGYVKEGDKVGQGEENSIVLLQEPGPGGKAPTVAW